MVESKLASKGGEYMATIIHEHTRDQSNSTGTVIVLLVVALLAILFFVYALPAISSLRAPQVNVPGKIDVQVNTPNK
jgi:hypothetical protein